MTIEHDDDDTAPTRAKNGYFLKRIRCGRHPVSGKSQQVRLTIATKDEAVYRVRLARLREVASTLTAQGLTAEAKVAIQKAAEQVDEVRFEVCCEAALSMAPKVLEHVKSGRRTWSTFGDVANAWTSRELHKRFEDQVKKKSDEDTAKDKGRLDYLCSLVVSRDPRRTLGELPLASVTYQHAAAAMEQLPDDCKRPAARRQYAQAIGRVLKLAVFPCEVLAASPLKRGWLPKVAKGDIIYPHFYPDEDLQLMRCELVEYGWRVLFGLCNREGARIGEFLRGLKWSRIEKRRGTIAVGKRKNGNPGLWIAEPGSIAALEPLRAFGLEGPFYHLPHDGKWAERLHVAMRLAELDRDALYDSNIDEGFDNMRAHDTRATYATLALAMGLNEKHIMDRTGHKTSEMVHRYDHAASAWQGGRLLPLDEALGLDVPKGRADGWVTGANAELAELAARLDAAARRRLPEGAPAPLLLGAGEPESVDRDPKPPESDGEPGEPESDPGEASKADPKSDTAGESSAAAPQTPGGGPTTPAREGETEGETLSGFSSHLFTLPDEKSSMFSALVAPPGVEPGRLAAGDFKSRLTVHDDASNELSARNVVAGNDANAHGDSPGEAQVRRGEAPKSDPIGITDPVLSRLRELAHAAVDRGDAAGVAALMSAMEAHRAATAAGAERGVA